ncbi:glycosyltransferase family 4 protein [Alteromonas ponticola]|uniref:Glycosyltransferase family 4 protein n=1 Tax=Alteromonas aquimaris TaxID=2998417 RepID=A0ABT3P3E7_9ALTE|nr:glycosyltransferase family 4 protein [Alteromonas aquimaris]MCW8107279.1 glycosyltransferase family 4 protein [Alteromonas aquimaris]
MSSHPVHKKRVLWINHFVPYPPKGGLLIRTYGLLEKVLVDHDVTLMCLVQPRLLTPYFESVEQGLAEAKRFFESKGAQIHFFTMDNEKTKWHRLTTAGLSLASSKPYSVNWLHSRELANALNQVDYENFDYIHVDTMGLLGDFGTALPADKTVINHHNAEHIMMQRRAEKETHWAKKHYYAIEAKKIAQFDAQMMRHYRHHIVCSPEDKEALNHLQPGMNVEVVPNGVAYKEKVTRTPQQGKLLFIGGLDWYPNHDAITFLLEAICPLIRQHNIAVHIDIIGKNPAASVSNLASQYEFVTIHGYVDDIDIFYQNAQAFLCPLRDGGGTKLKVLDAMNYGLPVIGSDIAFEGISVTHMESGFVVNSTEAIFAAICDLVDGNVDAESVGQKGRQLIAQKYDAKTISQNYSCSIKEHN